MKKYFISILILFSISLSEVVSPNHNSTLNMTHILFEWDQVPDAISYTVTIYDESSGEYINDTVESLIYINETFFNWSTSYSWYVSPIFEDGSQGSNIEDSNGNNFLSFSINDSRSTATATGSYMGNDITVFGSFLDNYSAAIDKNGNEIWHTSNNNLVFYNTDYYGQLFGAQYNNDLIHNLPVVEFDINSNIIWQDPNNHFSHHEMIQLPNGNYMSIVEDIQQGPIPNDLPNNLSLLFQFIGYNADGETNEFPWVGDRIVEWDQNGNEVWSWSTFDHYNMMDYDEIAGTWTAAYNDGRFDWTHANAFWFSEGDNAIYFSSRHLSRITKIDYITGEIIWNIGLEMPSGDIDCGQNLGFSFQHSIMQLDNGNLVTLDNGNISTEINNTDYPTSRGLEIEVTENNNSCEASLIWNYDLPQELFGFASGNVQKLNTGNYLITTVGDGGTSIEVTPNNEIIWQGSYNLTFPNGAVYRANRLPGLYPVAFSTIIEDMYIEDGNININNAEEINIELHNNGSKGETFYVPLLNEEIYLNSNDIAYLSIPIESNSEIIQIEIIPIHRQDLAKEITIYIQNSSMWFGCTDTEACNYNEDALVDDGTCEYEYDLCGGCHGNNDNCTIIQDIQGNEYGTVIIGQQNWMKQNLKTTTYNNGDNIPTNYSANQWDDISEGAYCEYNDNNDNLEIYGNLYNWWAANDDRGVCPEGWRIPSDQDWDILIQYLGGVDIAGGKLKENQFDYWLLPNEGATNESGFSALPSGWRHSNNGLNYEYLSEMTAFWSSNEIHAGAAYMYMLWNYNDNAQPYGQGKGQGIPVRCIEGILGCTDNEACNYNEDATVDDGTCEYFDSELVCDCVDSPPTFECWDGSLSCNQTGCPESPCDDNFTYFDTNEIPNSAIVLDGSQCFSDIDLSILDDIIQLNNLENEDAINLGTQNWFNGHITRLTIGDFYDGGNVTLTALPESIGDFPNLAILYLNYNELTSLPDSITNLSNLIYLVLSFNQLTHLPNNIGDLSNMIWFDLGYNSIEYLPESIGSFSMIQYLWIFNNQLSSLPNSICNLPLDWNSLDNNFLPYFGTGGNMLCEDLPECIANSQNINTSIDPLYYSFLITVEQDCSETECAQTDISGDGFSNVIDIVSLVNFILSEQDTSDDNLCTFDLTEDGVINVIDIVLLVNEILDN